MPDIGFGYVHNAIQASNEVTTGSSTWEVREMLGEKRTFLLSGSCLPFKPAEYSVGSRVKKTYYPGSDVATLQVLGTDNPDFTLQGKISTLDLMRGVALIQVKKNQTGNPEYWKNAVQWKIALSRMATLGIPLRVRWQIEDSPVTNTYDTKTLDASWVNCVCTKIDWKDLFGGEYEYSATFMVSSRSGVADISKKPTPIPQPMTTYQKLVDAWDTTKVVLKEANDFYRDYVVQTINKIDTAVNEVSTVVQSIVNLQNLPADVAKRVATSAANLRSQILDIAATGVGVVSEYKSVGTQWAAMTDRRSFILPWKTVSRSNRDDNVDSQTTDAIARMDHERSMKSIWNQTYQLAYGSTVSLSGTDNFLALYFVKEGDTLRRLAIKYYSDQTKWVDIARYNNLQSDILSVGMILIIPQVK